MRHDRLARYALAYMNERMNTSRVSSVSFYDIAATRFGDAQVTRIPWRKAWIFSRMPRQNCTGHPPPLQRLYAPGNLIARRITLRSVTVAGDAASPATVAMSKTSSMSAYCELRAHKQRSPPFGAAFVGTRVSDHTVLASRRAATSAIRKQRLAMSHVFEAWGFRDCWPWVYLERAPPFDFAQGKL